MSDQPWFKFYAADYLLDPDVDAISREAEALLIRMWCICHREGSCPVDVETLARKTQCSQQYVSQFKPQCEAFFELREGKLYSRRMEEEKRRSQQNRENANKRFKKQPAERIAEPPAEQMAERRSDSDSPPVNTFTSNRNSDSKAKAFRPVSQFTQADFDARDRRKLSDALNLIARNNSATIGTEVSRSWEQTFEWACDIAGISVERGLEVQASGKKWPQSEVTGASA